MNYELKIRQMLRTLSDNPDCGYIINFMKKDTLRNGKVVTVSILIENYKEE